ncbi:hypothetical protein RIF29_27606 [Crotalaria pallida]|uniref:Phytocyanin domain-containing protein n=1 Tax=Crotalaria pallida TaxID=3830 RepID=A0AAN9EPW7_CROPI
MAQLMLHMKRDIPTLVNQYNRKKFPSQMKFQLTKPRWPEHLHVRSNFGGDALNRNVFITKVFYFCNRELLRMEVKRKIIMCLLMTITMSYHITETESRETVLHRVGGGKYTWVPDVNFTDWASHEHFYKGDWLYFGFDKHIYNVLEVNKTSYENCNDTCFISNITRGGRDVFQLLEARPYYFLSGRGFCFKGMKVAINVEEDTPTPQPELAVSSKAFPSSRMSHTKRPVLLAAALAWTFIWKRP